MKSLITFAFVLVLAIISQLIGIDWVVLKDDVMFALENAWFRMSPEYRSIQIGESIGCAGIRG